MDITAGAAGGYPGRRTAVLIAVTTSGRGLRPRSPGPKPPKPTTSTAATPTLVRDDTSAEKRGSSPAVTAGDIQARTLLIDAAHSYRFPARIARVKLAAVDAVPEAVRVPPGRCG